MSNYNAKSIKINSLKEGVQKNVGMYLNSNGPAGIYQTIEETILNVVDEHVNGYGDLLIIHADEEKVSIRDYGRGIPIDVHESTGKPAIETILTSLHSGAKGNGKEDESYKKSGGMRGCGACITNFVSSSYVAKVYKADGIYQISFANGDLVSPLERVADSDGTTGTEIVLKPNFNLFKNINSIDVDKIVEMAKNHAMINKNLIVMVNNQTYSCPEGLLTLHSSEPILHLENEENELEEITLVLSLGNGNEKSFFNGLTTTGIHLNALKKNITTVFNKLGKEFKYIKGDKGFSGSNYHPFLDMSISVWSSRDGLDYTGQTKSELVSPNDIGTSVGRLVREKLEEVLCTKKGKAFLKKVVSAAQKEKKAEEATKKAREAMNAGEIKKGMTFQMPGNAILCTGKDPKIKELILTEGKSAGKGLGQYIDREYQSIMPLRGKIINPYTHTPEKVLANEEVRSIISLLGTGVGKDFDIDKLKYHYVVIGVDADELTSL